MAEEQDPNADEAEGLPESKSPWLKQFVILAVLALIAQSVVAYVLVTQGVMPKYLGEEEVVNGSQEAPKVMREAVPVTAPLLFDVGDMIVNPYDPFTIRYLSIKVTLEVDTPEALALLDDLVVETKVADIIREILNNMKYTDIDEADERDPLRQKLMAGINASGILQTSLVTGVYFTQFILQ